MRRLAIAMLVAVAACRPGGPQPFAYDSDACAQCRMQITDTRFGAELVTKKGRVVKFDAVECFIEYRKQAANAADVESSWVIDFRKPGTFLRAEDARYLEVPGKSPMGRGLVATATDADVEALRATLGGTVRRWSDLQ
jgi:copper chaperone NosL